MKSIKHIIKGIPFAQDIWAMKSALEFRLFSDELFIRRAFKKKFGFTPDLERPQTFNEKVVWRMLHDRDPVYAELSDKLAVRHFIQKAIGPEYLVELLGVYNSPKDIDFEALPDKFVLKCNHDSASTIICHDKSKFDRKAAIRHLSRHLRQNYYEKTREWHYGLIKPLIICEEFLDDSGSAPRDYKIYTFGSSLEKPIFIQCDIDRFSTHRRAMMTESWEFAKFDYKIKRPASPPAAPENLELMVQFARRLGAQFSMARVDFYELRGKLYFGELTFTPECGLAHFYPSEWDRNLGEIWDLNAPCPL